MMVHSYRTFNLKSFLISALGAAILVPAFCVPEIILQGSSKAGNVLTNALASLSERDLRKQTYRQRSRGDRIGGVNALSPTFGFCVSMKGGGMNRPRVLLADDHPLFLSGLRSLVEPECEVVGAVSDGRALIEAASRLKPEVVILDIGLPLLNGIDAVRQIKQEKPDVKILFLTMHANLAYLKEALAVGANGYLLKTSAREELLGALRDVIRNRIHVSPGFGEEIVNQFERHPRSFAGGSSVLTVRQREILQLVAEGRTAKEIAGVLNVSVQTVAFHKHQIMEKLGLRTTADLTKYAIQEGLLAT
jgi:DNA-binding NarL/FixJ family response regulator